MSRSSCLVWFGSVLTGQYEQANRYAIQTPEGHLVGLYVPLPSPTCSSTWKVKEKDDELIYSLAEEDRSLLSTMSRQFLHTHRPFKATIMNPAGEPILWVCSFFLLSILQSWLLSRGQIDWKLMSRYDVRSHSSILGCMSMLPRVMMPDW